ncbi:cytochrome c biogenesis protein CcdA [uncultured Bilophila sp.]|uniref:protein-disulfide reductase DsbD family protein n=1 Tax=uncultured Bilophila sp. TaxID=529385 RepID=UPI00280BE9F5|nr:cytochrome c biogenesis protein CcdA [uncultured Bilophila sp.]
MKNTLHIWFILCLAAGFLLYAAVLTKAESLPFSLDTEYAELDGHPAAVLWVTPQKGYHTYSHYADAPAPIPTSLNVLDAQGRPAAAATLYPQGQLTPDTFEPTKQILAYTSRFPIFIRFDAPVPGPLSAELSMLLCSDKNCVPVQQTVSLTSPETLPPPSPAALEAYGQLGKTGFPTLSEPVPPQAHPQQSVTPLTPLSGPSARLAPRSPAEPEEWRFMPRFPQESLEPTALGTALLLGLLAGLILNVMPCVLPVLTMKVSALLSASGHETESRRLAHFRRHNVLFAAGILTWFLVLAFCVGALGLAWGGLFQNTHLVYGLLILVFLLSLSLFDVFTLPVLDFKVGASRSPKMQAYLTGLVATLLATPCSGPLLGGVLGWAALQPLPVIAAVFTATGIGMALPYLILAAWPGAARILPKPGAWTGIMERLVGFFLMGTAIYLLSILPESQRLPALVTLLVCALAAWIWGHWGGLRASGPQKLFTGALALLMVGGSIWWSVRPAPEPAPWEAFQADTFRSLLKKEPLLVEFTADWCPSCKFLEQTVLTPKRLHAITERYGLRLIKVDLTRPDPEAQALLRAIGSVSIPVTAIFPKGLLSNSPIVLRDLYTAGQLEDALSTLSPRK